MNIPKNIDFSGIKVRKDFGRNSPEFRMLDSINEGVDWKNYCNLMRSEGVTVLYDGIMESFIVIPSALKNTLNESAFDDRELDTEEDDYMDNMFNDDPEEEEYSAPVEEPVIAAAPSAISADDVMEFLKSVLGTQPAVSSVAPLAPAVSAAPAKPTTAPKATPIPDGTELKAPPAPGTELQGGEDALLAAFFQTDGTTLDSDFREISDEIAKMETMKNTAPDYGESNNDAEPEDFLSSIGVVNDDETEEVDDLEGDEEWTPGDPASQSGIDAAETKSEEDDETPIEDPEASYDDFDDFETEDDKNYLEDDDEEIITEIDDPTEGFDEPEEDGFEASDEEEAPVMNVDKSVNMNNSKVQITLNGVQISISEIGYIGEAVKASGSKLKAIKGEGKKLNIMVEANNKSYNIEFNDGPRLSTKTPFKIGKHSFTTLEEALERIHYKKEINENRIFKNIMNKDLIERGADKDYKNADIFKEFKDINYIPAWNVMSVGAVNLKNGMNETYSNITQHGIEDNTLVITENNEYLLFKGNLKDRSKVGTTREIVEPKLKKSFGVGKVIGVFENDSKGLGQIMEKVKKTSIPLLVWK